MDDAHRADAARGAGGKVVAEQVADELLLLDFGADRFLSLNPVGARMWQLLVATQRPAGWPDGLGEHALLDEQDDIFIYAPSGKSYHKLIGNKRIKNGDKTCWRGVYTWFETPVADDADLLCYEGSAGGHTAVFIDCKRACKRTLALPGYLDLRHFGTAEQNGGIRISAAGRNKLKIKAGAPGSCVLLLRE